MLVMSETCMRVTVLGDSLLARHFVSLVTKQHPEVQLSLWTYEATSSLSSENLHSILPYSGLHELEKAMMGADVVVNLHECTDFSLVPNVDQLRLHNVEFVRTVLHYIGSPLVHLSSPFVQCSNRWPNVYEPERDPLVYRSQWPFPEYCDSKYEAETLIKESNIDCYIMRSVPTYGEGDDCSILTDLIRLAGSRKMPVLGDGDGHMQMAYASNVVTAMWTATCNLRSTSIGLFDEYLCKLYSDTYSRNGLVIPGNTIHNDDMKAIEYMDGYRARHNTQRTSFDELVEDHEGLDASGEDCGFGCEINEDADIFMGTPSDGHSLVVPKKRILEIFVVSDETPKKTLYKTYDDLLSNDKRGVSTTELPFVPLYYLYLLFCFLVRFITCFSFVRTIGRKLPSPSFLYFYFHHWTFFNNTKSLLLLDYTPTYDFKESIERSASHYKSMSSDDVSRYSWQCSMTK